MSCFDDADLYRFLAGGPGGSVVMLNSLGFRAGGGRERPDDHINHIKAAREKADPDGNAEPVYFGAG